MVGESCIGIEIPYLGTFIAKMSDEYSTIHDYDMIPSQFFASETGIHKVMPPHVNTTEFSVSRLADLSAITMDMTTDIL